MNIGQCEWGEIPVTCKCNCVAGGDTLKNHQTLTENTRLLTENITLRRELAEARQEIADRKADCETGHDQDKATIAELRQQLAERGAEIARLYRDQEQYGPDKVAIEKQAFVEADRQRQINELRKQLTEKDAEIERLRGMVDEIQAARHVHREHNQLLANLAASQAREQQLREAAVALLSALQHGAMGENLAPFEDGVRKALLQDTTAPSTLIAKASEVMLERAVKSCKTCDGTGGHEVAASSTMYFWKECDDCKEIRALPSVTLDDLKGGA